MNRRQLVVISERRGYWASQLRGRLVDRPVFWRETRGLPDLLEAVDGWPNPVVVLDLGDRPRDGLERLVQVSVRAPSALTLVLDPNDRPEVREVGRSLGASLVWSGFAPPPRVAELIDRWLVLSRRRASQAGRAALPESEPDPTDPITLIGE